MMVMGKKGFIILGIIVSIVITVSFITCKTEYIYSFDYSFSDTKLDISLYKSYPEYCFQMTLYNYNTEYKIESISFCSGNILIGDYIIPLETESTEFSVFIEEGLWFSSGSKGEKALSNIKNIPNKTLFNYDFYFRRMIEKSTVENIFDEYNNKKKIIKLNIKYKIFINNEPIIYEIDNEFEKRIKIKKYRYNIFTQKINFVLHRGWKQ
jgi:hypothetical protein